MKKLYTTTETIKYFQRRQAKLEQRRRLSKWKEHRRNKNGSVISEYGKKSKARRNQNSSFRPNPITIVVPERLDPMDSSSGTVEVYDRIRKCVETSGNEIYVDMSAMKEFTLAGVICLDASIKSWQKRSVGRQQSYVRGNLPNNPRVASEFMESGFFQGFTANGTELPSPKASWTSAGETKVASQKAIELVEFVGPIVELPQRQKNAIWQNLVECMTNTINHAKGREVSDSEIMSHERWFAGVMCKDDVADFAFVDLGVGICDSAQAKSLLNKLGKPLSRYGDKKLVREAFEGVLGSSTRKKGRGLGLPRMRHNAEKGLLQRLQVRTGRVIGDVESMKFESTNGNFNGTIITWSAFADGGQ